MGNGNNTNGIKLPVWAVSVITVLLVQLVMFVVSFATLKANQQNMIEDIAETKFQVGNISDGMAGLRQTNTRFDERCKEYDRRLSTLEQK